MDEKNSIAYKIGCGLGKAFNYLKNFPDFKFEKEKNTKVKESYKEEVVLSFDIYYKQYSEGFPSLLAPWKKDKTNSGLYHNWRDIERYVEKLREKPSNSSESYRIILNKKERKDGGAIYYIKYVHGADSELAKKKIPYSYEKIKIVPRRKLEWIVEERE